MRIFSFRDKSILRALSENSRVSVSDLAKMAHCSRITVKRSIDRLENRYDIKYNLEVNEDALGIAQRHLLLVKFDNKPKPKELYEIFKNDPYVNNAYICEGDFDLVIHTLTSDPMKYIVWESLLPGKLGDYGVNIYPSELMHTNFGYFPTSKQVILKFAHNIDEVDKNILLLLMENSRRSISDIARHLNTGRTTIYYRIFMLQKNGIIKRFTISINKPPFDYMLAYVVNYHFNKTSSFRSIKMMEYYKAYDKSFPILNTFQLLAPMSGSFRFFGIGIFENKIKAEEGALKSHKRIFKPEKPSMKYARIIRVLKGAYPFRNVDMMHNYTRFKWDEEDLK